MPRSKLINLPPSSSVAVNEEVGDHSEALVSSLMNRVFFKFYFPEELNLHKYNKTRSVFFVGVRRAVRESNRDSS